MTLIEAIQAAQKADDAWQAALVKAYGRKAGDARYDARGVATPELEVLYRAKVDADVVRWKVTFPNK